MKEDGPRSRVVNPFDVQRVLMGLPVPRTSSFLVEEGAALVPLDEGQIILQWHKGLAPEDGRFFRKDLWESNLLRQRYSTNPNLSSGISGVGPRGVTLGNLKPRRSIQVHLAVQGVDRLLPWL